MNLGTHMTKTGQLSHCKTLGDLVKEYNKHFKEKFDGSYHAGSERSVGHHDPVIDICKEAKTLPDAIKKAVDGRRRDGKLFSEGSCVRNSSKEDFEANLLEKSTIARFKRADDFEDIYDTVRAARPWGIGNTTTYNVSARIAAHLDIYPEKYLYIHAGPLKGWKRLTGAKGSPFRVPMEEVPKALRVLPPHSIEDFLCEMRDALNPSFL